MNSIVRFAPAFGRCRRVAIAVSVCMLVSILGMPVVGAQGTAGSGFTAQEIMERNELIAAQESLLNTYRCRFNIDTQVVPDGCVEGQPSRGPTQPDPYEGTPTQEEVTARDNLIQAQESLLNAYRCRFKIDTQVVPGGCNRIVLTDSYAILVMNGDGEDRQQVITADEFLAPGITPLLSSPAWSRDGTRIAFVVNFHDQPWDGVSDKAEIWVVNDDGTGLQNLTEAEDDTFENIFELSWSPDGTKLAFRSYCCIRQGRDVYSDLRIIYADGTNGFQLATVSDQSPYSWSPDGSQIVYSRGPTKDIWVANSDGTGKRWLADMDAAYGPIWSPDGQRIAVGATSSGNHKEIWVLDADGKNRRMVASSDYEFGTPLQRGEVGFSWSHDGERIAYFDVQEIDVILTVMDTDGSNKRQVAKLEGTPSPPVWSPDGTRIAYSTGSVLVRANGTTSTSLELWVIFADGTHQQRLVAGPVYTENLSWSS